MLMPPIGKLESNLFHVSLTDVYIQSDGGNLCVVAVLPLKRVYVSVGECVYGAGVFTSG